MFSSDTFSLRLLSVSYVVARFFYGTIQTLYWLTKTGNNLMPTLLRNNQSKSNKVFLKPIINQKCAGDRFLFISQIQRVFADYTYTCINGYFLAKLSCFYLLLDGATRLCSGFLLSALFLCLFFLCLFVSMSLYLSESLSLPSMVSVYLSQT